MSEELERPVEVEEESLDPADAPDLADATAAELAPMTAPVPVKTGDASLLALIDRLGNMLERSDLTEIEVEVGGTALVLRKPATIPQAVAVAVGADGPSPVAPTGTPAPPAEQRAAPSRPSINAPLTGIWYGSPAPGSAPFVEVGREVAVGQVVGLIEAMKLFNEIKSELAGRVVRVVPESGALVKAKQPLIEVDPL